MFKFLAIIYTLVVLSHELVLNTDDDSKSFYTIEKVDKPSEMPIIIRHIKNGNSNVVQYKVIAPGNGKIDVYDTEDNKNYLIIKSKKEAIDVVPYGLVQRLDKIKYMILWLNLYCEMHPDCDKSILDEELRKVVSAVGEGKEDKNAE